MNILMVLNARSIGGVETHVITLSEELSSRGHKVIVVSSNRLLGDILSNIGIKHYLASVHITTSLEDIKNILKYLYSFMFLFTLIRTENIEIVHVHGPSSSAILSFGVAKISKRALVYTHHVSYVKGLHFSALKVMGNHFDSIIAISGEIKDYLIKNINIIPYKIDIIYNGIKLDDYKNELPIFSKDIKKIIHISRLDSEKISATFKLIKSMEHINKKISAKLIIIGGGERADDIRSFANEISKTSNRQIEVIGEVNPIEIKDYLYEADIVIGAGRVAIEGMAARRPVIFMSTGGLANPSSEEEMELIKHYNFSGRGFIRDFNPSDIAIEIEKLLSYPDLYERNITLSGSIIRGLDINKTVSKTENIYKLSIDARTGK